MPAELGFGSGMTCLRRLKQWHRRGVFQKLYEVLLAELNGADKIDWSPALVDSATTKAPSGGNKTGPNPTDRRKLGSKVHVLVDAKGIPLAFKITGANAHDVTQVIPLVDGVPKVRGKKRQATTKARHRPRRSRL
jgi:transposase